MDQEERQEEYASDHGDRSRRYSNERVRRNSVEGDRRVSDEPRDRRGSGDRHQPDDGHRERRGSGGRGGVSFDPNQRGQGVSILVKNLNYRTDREKLADVFSEFGELSDVYIPLDYRSREPRGFAFCEYLREEDALVAISKMDGTIIDDFQVTVARAERQRKKPEDYRRRERDFDRDRRGGYRDDRRYGGRDRYDDRRGGFRGDRDDRRGGFRGDRYEDREERYGGRHGGGRYHDRHEDRRHNNDHGDRDRDVGAHGDRDRSRERNRSYERRSPPRGRDNSFER